MASQTKSIDRGVDRREARQKANTRPDHEGGAEYQIAIPSRFCAVCFLTFGSQERRVFEGAKAAHPRCVGGLRKPKPA